VEKGLIVAAVLLVASVVAMGLYVQTIPVSSPASPGLGPQQETRNPPNVSGGERLRGVFVMVPMGVAPWDPDLAPGWVAGVSVGARWKDVEPKEGAFNWSRFDAAVELAGEQGRAVVLRLVPGAWGTPDWVYEAGAEPCWFIDHNRYHKTYGQRFRTPLPWDGVWLDRWSRLIAAFGERYGGKAQVALIQMVGPAKTSGEMHLPKPADVQTPWEEMGYTRERLVSAWRRVLDAYSEAFPDKYKALCLANPINDAGVLDPILDYAYSSMDGRFCVQGNWFHGKGDMTLGLADDDGTGHRHILNLYLQYARRVSAGLQPVSWPTDPGCRQRMGDPALMFENGRRMGCTYCEVQAGWMRDAQCRKMLEDFAAETHGSR